MLGLLPALASASGQVLDDLQVQFDLLGRTGTTHFDDHVRPVVEGGRVYLADRSGRQRLEVEAGEDLGGGRAELGPDGLFDDVRCNSDRVVLELGQFGLKIGRQQVGARRKDLPELDKRRAKSFECHA